MHATKFKKVKESVVSAHATAAAAARQHIQTASALPSTQCPAAAFTPSELHDQCIASFNETVEHLRSTPQWSKLVDASAVQQLFEPNHPTLMSRPLISGRFAVDMQKGRRSSSLQNPTPWRIDYSSAATFRENRGECSGHGCALLQPTAMLGSLLSACSTIG